MNLLRSFAAAALVALSISTSATAQQDYPNRPITWVVPFAPGGVTDNAARFTARSLGERLGPAGRGREQARRRRYRRLRTRRQLQTGRLHVPVCVVGADVDDPCDAQDHVLRSGEIVHAALRDGRLTAGDGDRAGQALQDLRRIRRTRQEKSRQAQLRLDRNGRGR